MADPNFEASVLVTGSAGFIGSHVMQRLAAMPAVAAVAATRDGRAGTRRLDLRDENTLPAALDGVQAVVHCAVGDRAVTVDGTAALLRAAAAAGVRRVVHLSSVAVYGAVSGECPETAAMVPATGSGYAAWKAAAELACLEQRGVEIVRLRPAIVYGAGSMPWVAQLAQRIQSGRWGLFGRAGEGICNLVHVRDVADAAIAALQAPRAAGQALNINGNESLTWNGWFTALAQAIGAPPLQPVAPTRLWLRSLASYPVKAAARVSPGLASDWLLGAPARSELTLYALCARYPAEAATAALGWAPRVPIADGLAEAAEWLRSSGRVPDHSSRG